MQERTAAPSRCTVHAPHWATPQPYFVPVRPICSRSAQSSGVLGIDVDVLRASVVRRFPLALLAVCIASCATLTRDSSIDQRYGAPDPARYDKPALPEGGMSYRAEVQPILESRCVVCHACYDAPCQLKLSSYDGVDARRFEGARFTRRG